MPVNTAHPDYASHVDDWITCRDVIEGERAVKAQGSKYLPQLSGTDVEEYNAYKTRAMFYGATDRTVKGLVGAIFMRPTKVDFPESQKDLLKDIGAYGESFESICKQVATEVMGIGRFGLYLDAPTTDDESGAYVEGVVPYISQYFAENIINWRCKMVNGVKQLVMVVLKECNPTDDQDDEFEEQEEEQYRVCRLDEQEGKLVYHVEIWAEREQEQSKKLGEAPKEPIMAWERIEEFTPRMSGGKTLDYVPFVFINPTSITDKVEKSPVLDMVNINLSHYRNSADLEHGRHWTALPTAWAAGFDTEPGTQLRVGSSVAWKSSVPQASCGYLEFTGAGLNHLQEGMTTKEHLMAVQGARLLEEQKREAETAEAVRLRQQGEGSVLSNLADSVSEGMTLMLKWFAAWQGIPSDKIQVKLNKDYGVSGMDPTMLTALLAQLQSNAISWEVYFYNIKRGGIVPQEMDENTMRSQIEAGQPMQPPGELEKTQIDQAKVQVQQAKKDLKTPASAAA